MLGKQEIPLQTSLYLSVSGKAASLPHQGVLGSSHPPSTAILRPIACQHNWWHSSRKLCRREDELLFLAAGDHLPVLDKEEEQQPCTGWPCSAKGALGPLAAAWTDGCENGWQWGEGPTDPNGHTHVTWTGLRWAPLERFYLGCFGL